MEGGEVWFEFHLGAKAESSFSRVPDIRLVLRLCAPSILEEEGQWGRWAMLQTPSIKKMATGQVAAAGDI